MGLTQEGIPIVALRGTSCRLLKFVDGVVDIECYAKDEVGKKNLWKTGIFLDTRQSKAIVEAKE